VSKFGFLRAVREIVPDLDLADKHDRFFLGLFAVDIVLRLMWLDIPITLIFDEYSYVNAARVILGHTPPNGLFPVVKLGLDPVTWHPPLAKLLIALSILFLGDNGFGWRLPSALLGSAAVLVFYLLIKKVSADKNIALVATFLFSFDNLIFIQSRIAMLDIFTLAFMLIGLYWYFSGHSYASAIGIALSTLTKFTGASGFMVVVVVDVARHLSNDQFSHGSLIGSVKWCVTYAATYLLSFSLGLAALDYFWVGYGAFFGPFHRVSVPLGSHTSCQAVFYSSCPWQWLINQVPIRYGFGLSVGSVITFAMNPAILALAIPAIAYSSYSFLRKQNLFSLFNMVWFAVTYLPYYPFAIYWQAPTYIFYFLLAVPPLCAAIAFAIVDLRFPRTIVLAYLALVILLFLSTFPFKTIPP